MYPQTQYHLQTYNPSVGQPQYAQTSYAGAPQVASHLQSYATQGHAQSGYGQQQAQVQPQQPQQPLAHSQSLPTLALSQSEPLVRPSTIFATQTFDQAQYQRVLKRLASVHTTGTALALTGQSPPHGHASDPAQEAEIARLRDEVRALQGQVDQLQKRLAFYENADDSQNGIQADGWNDQGFA